MRSLRGKEERACILFWHSPCEIVAFVRDNFILQRID